MCFKVMLTVALTAYYVAIHFLKTRLDPSSYLLGGFSREMIAIIILIDWCILSTMALAVVATDLILCFCNMLEREGPKNSFPLSLRHLSGAG